MRRPPDSHPVWGNPELRDAASTARREDLRLLLLCPLLFPLVAVYAVLKIAQMALNLPLAITSDLAICLTEGLRPKLPSWRRIRGWP